MTRYNIIIWIFLSVMFTLFFTGCLERIRKDDDDNLVLASVGIAVLRQSDVKDIYTAEMSEADSLQQLEAYVNTWVRRQVKLQEAEKVLEDSGVDIEAMVRDYRNSLLIRRMDQYFVDNTVDTIISPSEVAEYYNQHKSEFVLDRAIVKGRIVRVPNTYRQQSKLKELMGSASKEKQKDFLDLCAKNNFPIVEYNDWTDFKEFLTNVPTIRGGNYDNMLGVSRIQELSDQDNKYFIQITESRKKGDYAPFETVDGTVRKIIYNQRSSQIIKNREDSLYNAALESNKIRINI